MQEVDELPIAKVNLSKEYNVGALSHYYSIGYDWSVASVNDNDIHSLKLTFRVEVVGSYRLTTQIEDVGRTREKVTPFDNENVKRKKHYGGRAGHVINSIFLSISCIDF